MVCYNNVLCKMHFEKGNVKKNLVLLHFSHRIYPTDNWVFSVNHNKLIRICHVLKLL